MSGDMFLCDEDNAVLEAIRKRLAAKVGDPLDLADHRPRHDGDGDHWTHAAGGWRHYGGLPFGLGEIDRRFGPMTFCDCPC